MKKYLSLLLAALMMVSVLAGCGGDTSSQDTADGGETDQAQTGDSGSATGTGKELKFSTGGEQGTYYGFGTVLAQAITSAGTGTGRSHSSMSLCVSSTVNS